MPALFGITRQAFYKWLTTKVTTEPGQDRFALSGRPVTRVEIQAVPRRTSKPAARACTTSSGEISPPSWATGPPIGETQPSVVRPP